jgi:mono/diheme cytochrome c family protein
MLLIDEGRRLIVADGFGGQLAVIDAARGTIASIRELPAHNIRGLSLNPDGSRLLVSHQILNSLARTTPDDVHWGMLMGNVVRALKLDHVRDPKADLLRESVVHPVGEAGNAAADPAEVEPATHGRIVVALSGVGEIGVFPEDDSEFHRVAVGGRPTALALSTGCSRAFAADELSDCVSVVDLETHARLATISLGPRPELTVADRGERLFYDGRLSHHGWMSCHSCHTDGHSNGLLNDNLGDGAFGAPKRVLPLGGVTQTGPWAWNGQMNSLELQISKSVETTMRGKGIRDDQAQALVAFLETVAPAPPAAELDAAAIERGRRVFESQNCKRCHAPPTYTSPGAYDVGLKDELDAVQFNPPSLRGVGQRDTLFHDNRARSLTEVFGKFKHQLQGDPPQRDLADLAMFLRSL